MKKLRRLSQSSEKTKKLQSVIATSSYGNIDKKGLPKLHKAVLQENQEKVIAILLDKQCGNTKDKLGRTPLHYAAATASKEMISLLVAEAKGIEIESTDEDKRTPLFKAVEKRSSVCTKLLIDYGAAINIYDKFLETPLHIASVADEIDVLKVLVQGGGDINVQDSSGSTPLHLCVALGFLDCSDFLLQNGASVNTTDNKGRTPLMLSAIECNAQIGKLLLDQGAEYLTKDNCGLSAFQHAARNKNYEMASIFRTHMKTKTSKIRKKDRTRKTGTYFGTPLEKEWKSEIYQPTYDTGNQSTSIPEMSLMGKSYSLPSAMKIEVETGCHYDSDKNLYNSHLSESTSVPSSPKRPDRDTECTQEKVSPYSSENENQKVKRLDSEIANLRLVTVRSAENDKIPDSRNEIPSSVTNDSSHCSTATFFSVSSLSLDNVLRQSSTTDVETGEELFVGRYFPTSSGYKLETNVNQDMGTSNSSLQRKSNVSPKTSFSCPRETQENKFDKGFSVNSKLVAGKNNIRDKHESQFLSELKSVVREFQLRRKNECDTKRSKKVTMSLHSYDSCDKLISMNSFGNISIEDYDADLSANDSNVKRCNTKDDVISWNSGTVLPFPIVEKKVATNVNYSSMSNSSSITDLVTKKKYSKNDPNVLSNNLPKQKSCDQISCSTIEDFVSASSEMSLPPLHFSNSKVSAPSETYIYVRNCLKKSVDGNSIKEASKIVPRDVDNANSSKYLADGVGTECDTKTSEEKLITYDGFKEIKGDFTIPTMYQNNSSVIEDANKTNLPRTNSEDNKLPTICQREESKYCNDSLMFEVVEPCENEIDFQTIMENDNTLLIPSLVHSEENKDQVDKSTKNWTTKAKSIDISAAFEDKDVLENCFIQSVSEPILSEQGANGGNNQSKKNIMLNEATITSYCGKETGNVPSGTDIDVGFSREVGETTVETSSTTSQKTIVRYNDIKATRESNSFDIPEFIKQRQSINTDQPNNILELESKSSLFDELQNKQKRNDKELSRSSSVLSFEYFSLQDHGPSCPHAEEATEPSCGDEEDPVYVTYVIPTPGYEQQPEQDHKQNVANLVRENRRLEKNIHSEGKKNVRLLQLLCERKIEIEELLLQLPSELENNEKDHNTGLLFDVEEKEELTKRFKSMIYNIKTAIVHNFSLSEDEIIKMEKTMKKLKETSAELSAHKLKINERYRYLDGSVKKLKMSSRDLEFLFDEAKRLQATSDSEADSIKFGEHHLLHQMKLLQTSGDQQIKLQRKIVNITDCNGKFAELLLQKLNDLKNAQDAYIQHSMDD